MKILPILVILLVIYIVFRIVISSNSNQRELNEEVGIDQVTIFACDLSEPE